jgi:hypothetical protein
MVKTKKIQIKDLAVGMKIKTKNEQGEVVFKTVTDKWHTVVNTEDQVRLEFENGVVINCSINHPIMVYNDSGSFLQKKPKELTNHDRVLTEGGFTRLLVADFEQQNDTGYIDITVEDTHTFFASNSNEGPMVLTHNSQGGIRNASCTVTFPIWHYQFEDLIVLKNNQGTDETRVRQMDYSIVVNRMFWNRYKNSGAITLFDPHEVPDLYEAYYRSTEEFEQLYLNYEKHPTIKKKVVSADEIFKNGILKERTDTGRIYLVNIDNVIAQGPFDTTIDPIYQSNLCLTGDTTIQIMNTDSNVQSMSLASFVEQYEFGAMTGVKVRSSNISTGEVTWNTVSNAAKTATVTELIEIEDESGKIIRCTPDHQIYTKNRGYVKAGELLETDVLCVES